MTAAALDATLTLSTGTPGSALLPSADPIGTLTLGQPRSEIVFIESDVPDLATLARELGLGRDVVILDAHADGLAQMTAALAGREGISAVHIVTHGSQGAANLGTLTLDSAAIATHHAELAALGRSLAPGADVLLYGCSIGAGAGGAAFVQQLALATGTDVAASDNPTGSASQGGDWQLEIRQGDIEAANAATATLAAQYSHTLGTVTFNTFGNFASPGNQNDPSNDVIYRVNGSSSTRLRIDGELAGVAAYNDGSNAVFLAPASSGGDASVTLSFDTGQEFTATSLMIANWDNYNYAPQTLQFKGYNASHQQVGSGSITLPFNNSYTPQQVTLSNMVDIVELKIFATTNNNRLFYAALDSIDISNIHAPPPRVSYVDSTTANGTYGPGTAIDIQVGFDQAVTVTGTPQLQLETGSTDRYATYVSGSGSSTLTFRYTVQAGDSATQLDYLSTAALTGTITAASDGTAANLSLFTPGTLGSLKVNAAIAVDGIAPTLAMTANDTTLVANQAATITFTFSEDPGSSFTAADISVSSGTLSALTTTGAVRTATFTPTAGVDSGAATISVTAGSYTDAVSNGGGAASLNLTWDTLAPAAPSAPALDTGSDSGSSHTDRITSDTTPTFSGTAEAGSTVRLYDTDGTTLLGSTTATGGSWTITASTLSTGSHTITAKATDVNGNVGSASAGTTITIDTAAPSAPTALDLDSGSDSGSSSSDNLTSDDTPTIGGTAEANSDITLYDTDGTTVLATTTANGSGIWSVATSTLGEGTHTITAKATDAAGNTSAASSGLTLTVDRSGPAAPSVPDLQTGSDSGSSSTDDITSERSPVFTGTAEAGATVTLYDTDGTTVLGSDTATGGSWTITASTLAEGPHAITAKATDAAGNVSAASTALSVTVDIAPPATTVTSAAFSADGGTSASDFITSTASQTISGTLSANLAAGESVEVSIDNGSTWHTATASAGQNTWSVAQTLTGSDTLQVRVLDAAGNTGTPWSHAYVLDTTAPTVTIASSAPQLSIGETALITFTFSEDPGSTFTDGDITVAGGTLGTLSGSGAVRTAVFTPTADTNVGTASITIAAGAWSDVAGNDGSAGATPSLTFDTLAPSAPGTPDLLAGSDSSLNTDDLTNDATPTFSGTAEAGSTVTLYDTDGTTVLGTGTATGGTWNITATQLLEGAHTIRATATDGTGNVSTLSAGLDVTIDTTGPAVAIASSVAAVRAGQTATITFTFSEDPGNSFTLADVAVSGGTLGALSGSGSTRTAVFTPTDGVATGTASIAIAAGSYQDTAGNNGGAGITPVLHIDTLPPAAPSVPDLQAGSDSGRSDTDDITSERTPVFTGTAEAGATVTLYDTDGTTVLGSDTATGGSWTITASTLAEGTHAITAKATDAAGNVSAASTALSVTVDITSPATTVTSVAFSADGGASASDFITGTASQTISGTLSANLAAGESVEVSIDNGATWHAAAASAGQNTWSVAQTLTGSDTLQVRVIDAAGNSSAALAQAYVLDTTAPTLAISSSQAQLKIGQTALISFTFSEDPGATFTAADISVSGGTLGTLSGSGNVRTAVFTPTAGLDARSATITVAAGAYADLAGNAGGAGATPSISFDTLAPAAPTALVLDTGSDSGTLGDRVTSATTPTVSGHAAAGTTVTLYGTDGTTVLGSTTADGGGAWHITTSLLAAGSHSLTAVATDAAGNTSASSDPLALTIDNVAPAAPAALALAPASDSGTAGDLLTNDTTPTITGTAEALASVILYGSDGTTVLGTAQANGAGAWSITASALGEGAHTLTAKQRDAAGNESAASAPLAITIDITPPAAPDAPVLAPASDTGTAGDRITWESAPVVTGTAVANATVTLYDTNGTTVLGTAHADGAGHWSIQSTALGEGLHSLTVRQADAAGNLSAASAALALTIESEPLPLVDGVPVDTSPVVLPSGEIGIGIDIPMVPPTRPDSAGLPGVADIPLSQGSDASLLLAQVAPGFGLSAATAPNRPAAGSAETLIAAIVAATHGNPAGDQQQLTGNGTDFLALLPAAQNLLVSTVKPVTAPGTNGVLTLSGANASTQSVALVIDTSGLQPGGRIDLERIDFAAIVGSADVRALSANTILTGDGASQHFTVTAGGTGQVFAGGGADVLQFGVPPAPQTGSAALRDLPGITLLHGGAGADTAVLNGTRASYNVEQQEGYLLVNSLAAPSVKALVVNVEQLQFSDVTEAVPADAALLTLAGLYAGALGRQADLDGFAYWGNVLHAGASWGAVALTIIDSPERRAAHEGFNGNAGHDLELLYGALFNRHSDAEGLAFWTSVLARGVSLEVVANEMLHSVEMVGHQRAAADWNFIV